MYPYDLPSDAQVNVGQPIILMKHVSNELKYLTEDFFDIFGNQYVPERDVICPHFGKLFRRKINKIDTNMDADNVKYESIILYNL